MRRNPCRVSPLDEDRHPRRRFSRQDARKPSSDLLVNHDRQGRAFSCRGAGGWFTLWVLHGGFAPSGFGGGPSARICPYLPTPRMSKNAGPSTRPARYFFFAPHARGRLRVCRGARGRGAASRNPDHAIIRGPASILARTTSIIWVPPQRPAAAPGRMVSLVAPEKPGSGSLCLRPLSFKQSSDSSQPPLQYGNQP